MINIINDNFNDLAKDYYKLQEDYETLKKIIDKLNNYLNDFYMDGVRLDSEEWYFCLLDIKNILKGGEARDN